MAEGCILPASKYLANRDFATPLNLARAGWAALERGEYAELRTSCHAVATTRGLAPEPAWVKQAP
jgi:hypothetical protein